MKQLKRLTSVLLVLGIVLGLMPLSAFAAESAKKPLTDEVNGNTYTYMPLDDSTVELTGFEPKATAANAVIHSPVTLNGKVYSVVSIGSQAFAYCKALKSVQFEAPIESIGDGAFLECTELGEVELPASIISIGTAAFLGCAKWETVKLGNSVVSIGENAFALCKNLKSVTIPSSVQTIGAHAFSFGPGGEGKQLVELHYTGTQEQWDGLAKKYDFENINPLLYKPKNFDCAHTVSFDYGGKAEGTSKVVEYEGIVTPPDDPTAKGYQFEGWYTQKNGGELFNFNQKITKDVTAYAHWSEVKPDHTVYFDCGSQAKGFSVVVQYEKTVKKPTDPEAEGYQFDGWYTQKNGGIQFDFSRPIKEDVTVYAHWSVKPKPEPNPNPNPEPKPNPTPTPDPDTDTAKEYTLTEKDGSLVRVTVEENGAAVDITKNVVMKKQGTTQIGKIPAGARLRLRQMRHRKEWSLRSGTSVIRH